jgi:quercetin dioxygenase-like cupin family protein
MPGPQYLSLVTRFEYHDETRSKIDTSGKELDMTVQSDTRTPYALAPGGGEEMAWLGSEIRCKASAPDIGVVEVAMRPGDEPPLHVHTSEDEWFWVVEGDVAFHVGGETYRGSAGSFASFPRGIPHTFTVESPSARFLVINTPGGFERMFELAPKTVEEAARALSRFGMEVVGPHPRDLAPA